MKRILIIAAALALSGCSDSNFFGDSPDQTATVASAPAQAPSEPAAAEAAPAPMQQAAPASADTATEKTPIAQSTPEPVAQASPSSNAHCTTLAKQRARDAAFAGEDSDTQEAVYKSTYADCVAWDLKHSL